MQKERTDTYVAAAEAAYEKYKQAVKDGVHCHPGDGTASRAATWLTVEYAYLGANGIVVDPKLTLWLNPPAAAKLLRDRRLAAPALALVQES